jgi:2-dehydro-3-deoxygalactonokinase
MNSFISCDWGTSSFRLRIVDAATFQFTSIEPNDTGIAKMFELWKQSGTGEKERLSFYVKFISDQIKTLEHRTGQSLENLPLIISGMASSSLGMMETGYKALPVFADGRDLAIKKIEGIKDFRNNIFLISGVRSDDDAMRGEETQLAGCEQDLSGERIFIFPGTHSKHVSVTKGQVTGIKTYMTGEFFGLLSEKSILSSSVQRGKGLAYEQNKKCFEAGVQVSVQSNLLHSAFLVRTNHLFNKLTALENYYYLSGLLIGSELRDLRINKNDPVTLVASGEMKLLYTDAFNSLGFKEGNLFRTEDSELALLKGQYRILKKLKK